MKLVPIPENEYDNYRVNAIFDCYKWDPQFLDNNTLAKYILVITEQEYGELKVFTEKLSKETIDAENFLNQNLHLTKPLHLSKALNKELQNMANYNMDEHVRLMRFDFHPTMESAWAISEVNSDVPGGFAEASLLPQLAMGLFPQKKYFCDNFGNIFLDAITSKIAMNACIMLVHCTCYSDDRQVMQFLGDELEKRGYVVLYGDSDHVKFENNKAMSMLSGNKRPIDAIIRFTPLEWIKDIKSNFWKGYFTAETVSCNHPIAIFTQTKRFPLIWDSLEANGIDLSTWRELLPETIEVKRNQNMQGYIYKPAHGRVGEDVSIVESCVDGEYEKILKNVKKNPKNYIVQKKFDSKPLVGSEGELFHACIGAYSVEGEFAGLYARISKTPRIDSYAADIPVLVERNTHDE